MRLLVVGAGAMGRWFARTVDADVAFADVDPGAAEDAAAALDGRAVPTDTDETFDAVCLAVPMSVVEAAIADHAPRADAALLDLSGVMRGPVAAMRERAPDRERASLHPLFAPENAPGNLPVVVDERGPTVDALLADLADAGNDVFETTAAEHDEAMETVQARAHTAVLAYALAAEDVREEFHTPISGELQGLVETVTDGTPQVYREIQETFEGADDVAAAARRLANAEGEGFDELYRRAGDAGSRPGDGGSESGDGGSESDDGGAPE
ncbi:MAG: prephenate dehydrogenase [Haloferacaceae archaeon]